MLQEMWRIVSEVTRRNKDVTVGELLEVIEPAMRLQREVARDYLHRVLETR